MSAPHHAPRWRRRSIWAIAVLLLGQVHAAQYKNVPPAATGAKENPGDAVEQPALPANYPVDFHPALDGKAEEGPGLVIFGPEASGCVKFEPGGLRITLPSTYPRQRQGTGVISDFGVMGNFEVTVSFEVLQEPAPAATGNPTDLTLVVVPVAPVQPGMWHKTTQNRAVLSWQAQRWNNPAVFLADSTRWNNQDLPRDQWGNEQFNNIELHTRKLSATLAKEGRLRLVRNGPTLYFFTSEGPATDFRLLEKSEFGTSDLKNVRILGSTGGPGAAFDVRVTDVRIRADAFLRAAAAPRPLTPAAPGRPWLMAVLVLAGLLATIAVSLGAWCYAQRRRAAPARHTESVSAAQAILFACGGCGKRLRARLEKVGKKVRCPQCAQGVIVPEAVPQEPQP